MNSSTGTHLPATDGRNTRRRQRGVGPRRTLSLRPSTPPLHWTFYNDDDKRRHRSSSGTGHLSARKLAAGLWQLRLLHCGYGGFGSKRRSSDRSRNGNGKAHAKMKSSQKQTSKKDALESNANHQISRSQSSVLGAIQGNLKKLESRFPHSIQPYCFICHTKLIEDQVKTMSLVSSLQAELLQGKVQIHDLESEVKSSKKAVKHLLRKLEVEKMSQQRKEHENIYALIDDLKLQLSRERKRRQRVEIINSQLAKDLAEAKLSAMQLIEKNKGEKTTRELMEVVCDELAKKIGEEKVEVEAMRVETMKIRQELEEEKEMLQMAEVWREERVQMKLVDAKLALESKYCQMNLLITALEAFLQSRSTSLDVTELRAAEMIAQAIKSVSIEDMEEWKIDAFSDDSSPGRVSVCHPVSPAENESTHSDNLVDYRNGPSCELEWDEKETISKQKRDFSVDKSYSNRKCVKGRVRQQDSMEHWGSSNMVNPHIARGMKGIIRRPKGLQKNILEVMIIEDEIESKTALLRSDSVD